MKCGEASSNSSSKCAPQEVLFKFLIVGDYGVGKTAIVRRYTEGRFSSNYKVTIGADFSFKSIQWSEDTKINLQLWDIAGHERFGYMTRVYYKYAVAAAIVFDVSRNSTFESVDKWLADLREKVTLNNDTAVPVVLLANKCDIRGTVVQSDRISKFCQEMNISAWFLTSAKDNINIDEAIMHLVELVMQANRKETAREGFSLELTPHQITYNIRSCCT